MLQRVRELVVQYNNGTLSVSDKASITNEVAQLTKLQILQQAGTSMLAQANQSAQTVLKQLNG